MPSTSENDTIVAKGNSVADEVAKQAAVRAMMAPALTDAVADP